MPDDWDQPGYQDGEPSPGAPALARAQAVERGYHTPGTVRLRLGLTNWQMKTVERTGGLLPEPDLARDHYQRWSVDLIERDAQRLRAAALAVAGTEPPLGAHKLAARLAASTGRDVVADDVHVLVERGELRPIGEWMDNPVYDVRHLAGVDVAALDEVVAARPRRLRERELLRRDQCEALLGIRAVDFRHLVRRGLIAPAGRRQVWMPRAGHVDVPTYRASDVDDLLAGPIDWDSVRARASVPGARSLLLGDDPLPTREDAARRRATETLVARHRAEFEALAAGREPVGEPDPRDDLITTLNLYVGRFVWEQLSREQKDLMADLVDARHRRQDEEEQTPEERRYAPVERWWR